MLLATAATAGAGGFTAAIKVALAAAVAAALPGDETQGATRAATTRPERLPPPSEGADRFLDGLVTGSAVGGLAAAGAVDRSTAGTKGGGGDGEEPTRFFTGAGAIGKAAVDGAGEWHEGRAMGDPERGDGAGDDAGRRRRRFLGAAAAAGEGGGCGATSGAARENVTIGTGPTGASATEGGSAQSPRPAVRDGSLRLTLPLFPPLDGAAAVDRTLPLLPVGAAGGRPPSAAALGPRSSVPDSLLTLVAGLAAGCRCSAMDGGGKSVGGGGSGATDVDAGNGSRAETGASTGAGTGADTGVASPAAAAAARHSSSIADGSCGGGGAGRSGPFAAPTVATGAGPMTGAGSSPTPRHTARGE